VHVPKLDVRAQPNGSRASAGLVWRRHFQDRHVSASVPRAGPGPSPRFLPGEAGLRTVRQKNGGADGTRSALCRDDPARRRDGKAEIKSACRRSRWEQPQSFPHRGSDETIPGERSRGSFRAFVLCALLFAPRPASAGAAFGECGTASSVFAIHDNNVGPGKLGVHFYTYGDGRATMMGQGSFSERSLFRIHSGSSGRVCRPDRASFLSIECRTTPNPTGYSHVVFFGRERDALAETQLATSWPTGR